jgi:uncharacterized Zn-binding protein involved in type VI secretion
MKNIVMAVLMSVYGMGLVGCADPKIDDGSLKRYKSTKKDVRRLLGKPDMVSTRNGKETWTYNKSSVGINGKGAAITGGMMALTTLVPGAALLAVGAHTVAVASDPKNASPFTGKSVSASYTFNRRGLLVGISKSSF